MLDVTAQMRPITESDKIKDTQMMWGSTEVRWLSSSTNNPGFPNIVEHSSGLSYVADKELFQKPIGWLKGRPVYFGEKLYWKDSYTGVWKSHIAEQFECVGENNSRVWQLSGDDTCQGYVRLESLYWEKPPEKKFGWINVYPGNEVGTKIYSTKASAANDGTAAVQQCKIEWME